MNSHNVALPAKSSSTSKRHSWRTLGACQLGTSSKALAIAAVLGTASISSGAIQLDLTTAGASGIINNAIFQQGTIQPAGTGVFNTFVQVKVGGNTTTERAYNTTINNTLDVGPSDQHNHSITLGEVPKVSIGNIDYRAFSLDINEANNAADKYLSLDEVQLFVGGTANSSVSTFFGPSDGAALNGVLKHDGTLVYRMDAGMDNWVALNYDLAPGSGGSDMNLYVLDSLFTGRAATEVVTLYSQFGLQGPLGITVGNGGNAVFHPNPYSVPNGDYGNSADFEEWGLVGQGGGAGPSVVQDGGQDTTPEPFSLLVWSGLAGAAGLIFGRQRVD